jgi:DNA-directed RNA polymerase specialized sigma24 family protein
MKNLNLPAFPSTQWTRLEREGGTAAGREWFCETYRPAVLEYLRSGHGHHEAEDLCQEFFSSIVLGRDIPGRADRDRGSLRGLLHTALRRFLSSHKRKVQALKRGGAAGQHVPLDAEASTAPFFADKASVPPDRAFDQAWAAHLLKRAIDAAEEIWHERGKQALFARLRPALDGSGLPRPHAEIAAELGMKIRDVTVGLSRLRQLTAKLLFDEVAGTVAGAHDVHGEWAAVRQALERH